MCLETTISLLNSTDFTSSGCSILLYGPHCIKSTITASSPFFQCTVCPFFLVFMQLIPFTCNLYHFPIYVLSSLGRFFFRADLFSLAVPSSHLYSSFLSFTDLFFKNLSVEGLFNQSDPSWSSYKTFQSGHQFVLSRQILQGLYPAGRKYLGENFSSLRTNTFSICSVITELSCPV